MTTENASTDHEGLSRGEQRVRGTITGNVDSVICAAEDQGELRHCGKRPRLEGSDNRRTNETGSGSNMLATCLSKQIGSTTDRPSNQ